MKMFFAALVLVTTIVACNKADAPATPAPPAMPAGGAMPAGATPPAAPAGGPSSAPSK